jgi:hypothetical protein
MQIWLEHSQGLRITLTIKLRQAELWCQTARLWRGAFAKPSRLDCRMRHTAKSTSTFPSRAARSDTSPFNHKPANTVAFSRASAMSHIRTSLPIPTQPWETAKAKFLDGLSAEEVSRYQTATIENMFYKSDVIHKKYAQESKTCRLQERISPLVDVISDYGKALDVYVNSYGLILSPPWGSMRVILHVSLFLLIFVTSINFLCSMIVEHTNLDGLICSATIHITLTED